jgi:hypothetical protein
MQRPHDTVSVPSVISALSPQRSVGSTSGQ